MGTDNRTPMTKERAGEILYESVKRALMHEGLIDEKEHAEILMDFREDLALMELPEQEIVDFVEFLRDDVNRSLQTH